MFPTGSLARSTALPADLDQITRLAIMLAACTLMSSRPDLPPHEAVRDVWQLYQHIQDFPPSTWPW